MQTKIERGKNLQITVYNGDNIIIIDCLKDYLTEMESKKIPIPLGGSEFKIKIDNFDVYKRRGAWGENTMIIVKGEVV